MSSGEANSVDAIDNAAVPFRRDMVDRQLRTRDITDSRVLQAMNEVPRHRFVPGVSLETAYGDHPVSVGENQTMSQPYIVALMAQAIRPKPSDRVLDVGTGCGYHAAVLSRLVQEVKSIEIIPRLSNTAQSVLKELGCTNIECRIGDAWYGWPEQVQFDGIVAAAAPSEIPETLVSQLRPGGRLVIPVGLDSQRLIVVEKKPDGRTSVSEICRVSFVPMTGRAEGMEFEY